MIGNQIIPSQHLLIPDHNIFLNPSCLNLIKLWPYNEGLVCLSLVHRSGHVVQETVTYIISGVTDKSTSTVVLVIRCIVVEVLREHSQQNDQIWQILVFFFHVKTKQAYLSQGNYQSYCCMQITEHPMK